MGRQGIERDHGPVGVLAGEPVDEMDLSAYRDREPAGAAETAPIM